jgi:hypothetical protein
MQHYSPVMIAPLSINSSRADCTPEGGLEEQIDKNRKLAQAWGLKDKIYLAQRDFTPAKAEFLQPIELDPKLEGAYLLLGRRFRPKS